ncbi:MAG: ATP synthase F1 subunit delta [Bacteroidales bacterium]|nr:ATP synthase F1 subunit delta [Bacteroidales bacterium]
MDGGLIARRYATVLYDFGVSKDSTELIYADANKICEAFKETPEALEFFCSPLKKVHEKKDLIKSAFGNVVSPATTDFLLFVADKNRISMIDEILRVYQVVYKERNDIHTAEVTTARALSAEKCSELTQLLEKKVGAKVDAKFKTDERIIGGVIICIDGKQVDCSISRQLADIEKSLTV